MRTSLAALLVLSVLAPAAHAATAAPAAVIRVDQLGWLPREVKVAHLVSTRTRPGAVFRVVDGRGRTVLTGHAGASRGAWNRRYLAVEPLDLTHLRRPGTYRIRIAGLTAMSPPFRIASGGALLVPRVADAVAFFTAQRDGRDVIAGPLHRRPAHLADKRLTVDAWPHYADPGSDVISGRALRPIAGPVDLEGGWMDAGDFIKLTHTTAYADTLLFAAERALGTRAPASLDREARFGLRWLTKAWDPRAGVLYEQVGIGSGNAAGTFAGDHDLWRLPQRDDHLGGSRLRYLRHRPAFRANEPGDPLPPNLAGRVAAAFAIAAQLDARHHRVRARAELEVAATIFGNAKTSDVKAADVVTALPHEFYPESSWRDDLELAGAELALAGHVLGDPRASAWLDDSAHWGREYLDHEAGQDTLNLYDTSALAHADLVRAMRVLRHPAGLAIGERPLLADLRAQLSRGRTRAATDPFQAGVVYDDFDAAPHAFGLVATAALYARLTHDHGADAFATAQRDWTLGDNAWGASLMIGVGSSFPHCPQHVVANLSGSLDGRTPLLRGAVVNGPNDASLFSGGLGSFFDTAHSCPASRSDRYAPFNGHGSRYVDDVRSWQTVEPALDFTATAALAFAVTA